MRTGLSALLIALLACPGFAREIYVDDDAPADPFPFDSSRGDARENGSVRHPYDGIQEAIDAAADRDTIIVAPGWYLSSDPWVYDEIDFKGKDIRLLSSSPTDLSVANETVLCGVVIFDGIESGYCRLQGFKIQNHTCGGILGNSTAATISHCILSGNGPCGATVIKDVRGPIRNCLIVDNTTFHSCGLEPVVSGFTELVNCTIANNLTGVAVPAGEEEAVIRNCIICGNHAMSSPPAVIRSGPTRIISRYSLLEDSSGGVYGNLSGDPCFVQAGYWAGEPSMYVAFAGASVPLYAVGTPLVEGDYHLQSEGWRWSEQEVHGSHWYYDPVTSLAVDAGDPLGGLGEEPERASIDPDGRCGFNHCIDMGAYGGTTQGSMAPADGFAPGPDAVDLHDYWPLRDNNGWTVRNLNDYHGRSIQVNNELTVNGFQSTALFVRGVDWASALYCVYLNHMLYTTQYAAYLNRLPQVDGYFEAQYPQYLVPGSIVETPYNPFQAEPSGSLSTLVLRGSLQQVLAGTDMGTTLFVAGDWSDVIAFKTVNIDGTPGVPITIFARGFGPLMIGGLPVERAYVGGKTFQAEGLSSGISRR